MLRDETEMIDHGMAVDVAELALEAEQDRPRLRPLELELALALIGLDAVERGEEIGLPGRAAVFAVGDRLQAGRLLLADERADLVVLDQLERRGADLAALALLARHQEDGRAQQAADVIGPEGRVGALHGYLLPGPVMPRTSGASSSP